MAARDDYQDPYDQPYPTQTPTAPTDPYDPTTNPNGTQPIADTVAQMYRSALGREATSQEIQDQIRGGSGDIVTIQKSIYGSPEAQAYNASKQAKPHGDDPGTTPTPTPTTAPTNTGGPGPAPTPSVAPPVPTPPPAFHYDDFTAPDPNDLSSDPGFQFENAQGMQAIGARNAALGTLNTGGTLKDYVSFGQNLAHTRYGDLFNRKLTQYGTNRGNALDAYNVNYGTQVKDPWNEAMQRASLDQNTNQFNSTQDFNKWLEQYKRSTLDPFDQKYKTLSLL